MTQIVMLFFLQPSDLVHKKMFNLTKIKFGVCKFAWMTEKMMIKACKICSLEHRVEDRIEQQVLEVLANRGLWNTLA